MAAQVSDEQRLRVRNALREAGGNQAIVGAFKDGDLNVLFSNGWDTGAFLLAAQREDLLAAGISRGALGAIMSLKQGGAGGGLQGAGGGPGAETWRNPVLRGDDSETDMYNRISMVMEGVKCIGTVARISTSGLCVSCTHVFVSDGQLIKATAFGGEPMELLASFPSHDIIFLRGPPGPAFNFPGSSPPLAGREIFLLAHPKAPQVDLGTVERPLLDPMQSHGRIVGVSPGLDLCLADYHAAMPNSSGGAVLSNSKDFAGTHVGTTFHEDCSNRSKVAEDSAPDRIDTNPKAMWPSDVPSSTLGGSKRRMPRPNIRMEVMRNDIQYAMDNIPHKDQLALFVPSQFIYYLADRAGIFSPPVFRDSIHAAGQGFVGHQRGQRKDQVQEQEQRFYCQIS